MNLDISRCLHNRCQEPRNLPQRPPTPQSQPPPLSRLSTSQHNPLDLKTSPVAIDKTRRGETTAASSSGYLKPLPSPNRTDPWRACLRQTGVPPPTTARLSVVLPGTGQGRGERKQPLGNRPNAIDLDPGANGTVVASKCWKLGEDPFISPKQRTKTTGFPK